MPRERDGRRAPRSSRSKRVPDLGYYYIVTDTKETEKNYLNGLRDALPPELQGRLVIKVSPAETKGMISACECADVDPQYRQCWIVFDRDQVVRFDEIISAAESRGIQVGWSNPCIEIWFGAYFGKMLAVQDSVSCCQKFAELFEKKSGQRYRKDHPQIYALLNRFGDEEKAVAIAEQRLQQYYRGDETCPSRLCPCTMLHHLVHEIRQKTADRT